MDETPKPLIWQVLHGPTAITTEERRFGQKRGNRCATTMSPARGIVGEDMPSVLGVTGMIMGLALILLWSPMLFPVGMYLPLPTTFAIFRGRHDPVVMDSMAERKGFNAAQRTRVENIGVLSASGMIAGEALVGLLVATFRFFEWEIPHIFAEPSFLVGFGVMLLIIFILVRTPLANPGRPEEPAPPTAMM